jgi:hypothetical protein
MTDDEPYDFSKGEHGRPDMGRSFPSIRARRCSSTTLTEPEDDQMFSIVVGLRVMSCFSGEFQTLSSEEIAHRLDLSATDVACAATRLACLGYLAADPESNESAWMLMPDDG